MSEHDLESLLNHLRRKLSPFVGRSEVACQVEIHIKGDSIQTRVTEINGLLKGKQPLEERR